MPKIPASGSLVATLGSQPKLTSSPQEIPGPVWGGPESNTPNGGVTFSLLSRFLTCRARFKAYALDGWGSPDQFNHKIEYGSMWHICEEAAAQNKPWEPNLQTYAKALAVRYPMASPDVDHWYNVCKIQFPIYLEHWKKHPDVRDRVPLFQERVFSVPYKLASGRTVYLRGKWDSVDIIREGKSTGVYLQENKTKGDIDEVALQRQLRFDLQTMLYMTALRECQGTTKADRPDKTIALFVGNKIKGVRYNVVRRPLSGGKGNIRQHKPTKTNPTGESKEVFYKRLGGLIDGTGKEEAPGPGYFFMRWKVDVTERDMEKFRVKCLDPILEFMCLWWDMMMNRCVALGPWQLQHMIHWQHPFGVYNVLDEGGHTDVDEYLETGSTVGLARVTNLFPELVV